MEFVSGSDKLENAKCGHFSIRGYVAEIRRKDSKICWPFPMVHSYKDSEELADVLPPLHVAEYRWWGCQNCLNRNEAIGVAAKTGEIVNYSNNGFKTRIICSHGNVVMSSDGDAPKLISGVQESKEKSFEGIKADADATINANGDEYGPSLCSDKKEQRASVVHPIEEDIFTSKCHDDDADDGTNEVGKIKISFNADKHGCNLSACKTSIASKSVCNDKNASETVTLKEKGNGSIEFCKPNHGICKLSDTLFHIGKLKCTSDSSTEICHKKNPRFSRNNLVEMNQQHRMEMTDHGICKVVDVNIHENEDLNAVTGHVSKLHSIDESDCDSFENDENIVGNNIFGHCASENGDSGGTLHRRKIRKVRLLSDILRSEALGASGRDANLDHINTEATHSKAARDVSTGIGLHPGPKSQMAVQGYDRKVILGRKKKRKMPLDEDEGPLQMKCPKGAPEKVLIFKGDTETRDINTAIVDSESEADAFVEIVSHPGLRSRLTEHGNDKKKSLGKKKRMMPQVEDGGESPLMTWQEGMCREVQIPRKYVEIKCTGAESAPSNSVQDVFNGRRLHPDFKSHAAAQSNGKKAILGKNKYVNCQVEDGKSFLMSWKDGMTGKDHIIRRDADIESKGAATIPFRSAQGAFSGGGVFHGPSHAATNRKYTMNKKQNSMPIIEGGVNMPHVEYGGSSLLCQPEAFSDTCENPNLQRYPKVLKSQFDQIANMTSLQAAVDDIPMDIVELMAKNQHERLLFNAEGTTENKNLLSGTSEKVKDVDPMNFTEVLGSEMLRLRHKKNSHVHKTQSSDEGSSMFIKGKRVASTKQKSDGYPSQVSTKCDRTHFSINQPKQSHASMGFTTFLQSREKPSSGAQFPVIGSSRNHGDRNSNRNGNAVQDRCFLTSLQPSDAYQTSHTCSQRGSHWEDHRVWSSMIPSCKPFGINHAQKVSAESSNMSTLSPCLEIFPKGNMNANHGPEFMSKNGAHLEKQKRKFDSDETNKRTHPKSPFSWKERGNEFHPKMMGPLDLYANEAIPAMYLLRLMDAGVCSSTPVNVDKNRKFTKQLPYPHDHHHEELSELEVGQAKNSEASMHPPSSNCFDKNRLGKSGEHFHSVPKAKMVGSSLQKYDENCRRATGSRDNFSAKLMSNSLKSQVKEKTKGKMAPTVPTQPTGLRSHRSISRDDSSGKDHELYDLQKGLLSASGSVSFPVQSQAMKHSGTRVGAEVNKNDTTVWPGTNRCGTEICVINRNPADFSVPDAGNVYMIGPGDLKHRKMLSSRARPSLIDPNGHKRQRMMKLTAIQAHLQH